MMNNTGCEQPLAEEEVKAIATRAAEYRRGPTSPRRKNDESLLRYFQFNVSEWMSDPLVAVMSDAQRGRYVSLLAACWPQGGVLPSNPKALYSLSRASCTFKQFTKELNEVMAPFERFGAEGEQLRHPKFTEQWEKSNKHYQQRIDAGKASWEKKKQQEEIRLKALNEAEA